jgi:hypothetical protein
MAVTKAVQEQIIKLRDLHRKYRNPPQERVNVLTKTWKNKQGQLQSLDLDYVGHAHLRDILCDEDPLWTWRALGKHPQTGAPVVDKDAQGYPIGLWIGLTIHGVEKPGYGSCESAKHDAVKELIGDALRNAAQSFGIAIALWAKSELADLAEHEDTSDGVPPVIPTPDGGQPVPPPTAPPTGQCPECHGPAGRHATGCKAAQGAAPPANGNAPAAVKAPLTPEAQAAPDQTPAPEAPPDAAADQLEGEALRVEVGKRLGAMRGQQAVAFAAEKKAQGWPGDMTTLDDDGLRAVLAWLQGQPVERVVQGS